MGVQHGEVEQVFRHRHFISSQSVTEFLSGPFVAVVLCLGLCNEVLLAEIRVEYSFPSHMQL